MDSQETLHQAVKAARQELADLVSRFTQVLRNLVVRGFPLDRQQHSAFTTNSPDSHLCLFNVWMGGFLFWYALLGLGRKTRRVLTTLGKLAVVRTERPQRQKTPRSQPASRELSKEQAQVRPLMRFRGLGTVSPKGLKLFSTLQEALRRARAPHRWVIPPARPQVQHAWVRRRPERTHLPNPPRNGMERQLSLGRTVPEPHPQEALQRRRRPPKTRDPSKSSVASQSFGLP